MEVWAALTNERNKEGIVKKLKVIALMIAVFSMPAAVANASRVLGESLDSGLGDLPAGYTAKEYMPSTFVPGEKLDSGLGELAPGFWKQYLPESSVLGEKLDSGLGELTSKRLGK
jgi:hypothetical protein